MIRKRTLANHFAHRGAARVGPMIGPVMPPTCCSSSPDKWSTRFAPWFRVPAVSVATAFLLASHLPSAAEQMEGPPDRLRVGDVDPEWFDEARNPSPQADDQERRIAQAYPGRILRHGDLLALKLENGKFVWLVDMQSDPANAGFGCCEAYRLVDNWPNQKVYVVDVSFGEASRYWLVSA